MRWLMQASDNKTFPCPECGAALVLVPKEGVPEVLIGYHACGDKGPRPVVEIPVAALTKTAQTGKKEKEQ